MHTKHPNVISREILFAFKNWKIASRYGFASGVSRPKVSKQQSFDAGFNTGKRTDLFWHKIVLFGRHNLTHSVACCTDGGFAHPR